MRRCKTAVRPIVGCYILALGSCVALAFSSPYYDTSSFESQPWYGWYYDLKPRNELSEDFQRVISTMEVPPREASAEAYRNGGIIIGDHDDSPPRIVVLGDSHGVMWADAIRSVTETLGIKTSIITMNGVSPFITLPLSRDQGGRFLSDEEKYAYDSSRLELVEAWKPELTILCCRWSRVREADTKDLLDFLEQHSEKILLMEQPPELANVVGRNALQYLIFRGVTPTDDTKHYLPAGNTEGTTEGRELIRTIERNRESVDYISIYDQFVENTEVLALEGRHVVYVDDDHLTTYGARLARSRIEQAISDALR